MESVTFTPEVKEIDKEQANSCSSILSDLVTIPSQIQVDIAPNNSHNEPNEPDQIVRGAHKTNHLNHCR